MRNHGPCHVEHPTTLVSITVCVLRREQTRRLSRTTPALLISTSSGRSVPGAPRRRRRPRRHTSACSAVILCPLRPASTTSRPRRRCRGQKVTSAPLARTAPPGCGRSAAAPVISTLFPAIPASGSWLAGDAESAIHRRLAGDHRASGGQSRYTAPAIVWRERGAERRALRKVRKQLLAIRKVAQRIRVITPALTVFTRIPRRPSLRQRARQRLERRLGGADEAGLGIARSAPRLDSAMIRRRRTSTARRCARRLRASALVSGTSAISDVISSAGLARPLAAVPGHDVGRSEMAAQFLEQSSRSRGCRRCPYQEGSPLARDLGTERPGFVVTVIIVRHDVAPGRGEHEQWHDRFAAGARHQGDFFRLVARASARVDLSPPERWRVENAGCGGSVWCLRTCHRGRYCTRRTGLSPCAPARRDLPARHCANQTAAMEWARLPTSQMVAMPAAMSNTCCTVAASSRRWCRPGMRSATDT